MLNTKQFPLLGLYLLLTACVTVNVYFPAAAAEQAADKFVKDVYGESNNGESGGKQPPAPDQQGYRGDHLSGFAVALADLLIPSAHAQQPDINIATPGINKLKASMQARHAALSAFYNSGAIGMTNNGLLAVRDAKAIPLKDRNRVNKLVADENRDRNLLYAEIAKANGHPEWEAQIRSIFAQRWVANAPAGWWYQSAGGGWTKK